jgi:hypothetical protein
MPERERPPVEEKDGIELSIENLSRATQSIVDAKVALNRVEGIPEPDKDRAQSDLESAQEHLRKFREKLLERANKPDHET